MTAFSAGDKLWEFGWSGGGDFLLRVVLLLLFCFNSAL